MLPALSGDDGAGQGLRPGIVSGGSGREGACGGEGAGDSHDCLLKGVLNLDEDNQWNNLERYGRKCAACPRGLYHKARGCVLLVRGKPSGKFLCGLLLFGGSGELDLPQSCADCGFQNGEQSCARGSAP